MLKSMDKKINTNEKFEVAPSFTAVEIVETFGISVFEADVGNVLGVWYSEPSTKLVDSLATETSVAISKPLNVEVAKDSDCNFLAEDRVTIVETTGTPE